MTAPKLRLTEADPDLRVSPETLLKHLRDATIDLEELVKKLNCSPDDLRETLDDSRTANLIKLKTQLAAVQVKIIALEYVPAATVRLAELIHESQKPEVARRASTTIAQLAGISTKTKAADPEPIPQAQPEDPADEPLTDERHTLLSGFLGTALALERHGYNIGTVPQDQCQSLAHIFKLLDQADPKTLLAIDYINNPAALANIAKYGAPYVPYDVEHSPNPTPSTNPEATTDH